jgi:hypothetical protein
VAGENLALKLIIGAEGDTKTIAQLAAVQQQIEKTAAEAPGISRLAQTLGGSYAEAKKFADGLGLTADQAAGAIASLRQLNGVGADSNTKFATVASQLKISAEQFGALDKAAGKQKTSLGSAAAGAAELAFRFNNVVGALQNVIAAARPAYDLLIGSNEKLNAQLLSSQTNLANAANIKVGGQEVTDPTAKIKASEATLRQALKQIEIDTQSLVGVTSSQVNELFQITLTNAGALNNQSKQFPDAIGAATSLTKGWAASLKVVGIPLNQARQEINSIIKGQITQDSILAKNLNITNQQVETWRSQGRLVDELNGRLNTYVAGNAIAARSIEGISSNIQDLIERIGREAGTPLLAPIIDQLANVEKYLKANEGNITAFFKIFTEGGARAIDGLKNFGPTFQFLENAVTDLATIGGTLFNALIDGSVLTAQALQLLFKPVLDTIGLALDGYAKVAELINERKAADVNDTLETYSNQVLDTITAVGGLSSELKKLNAIRASGGQLSAEQLAREKQLTASAKIQLEAIESQVKTLKEVTGLTSQQTTNRDNQVKILEAQAKKLQEVTGGLVLEGKTVEVLGTTKEQFAKREADLARKIKTDADGQSQDYQKAIKDQISLAKSRVDAKDITVEAARAQLEAIKNNTKADVESQTAAKKEIDSLYDGRISKIKELIEIGQTQAGAGLDELAKIRDDAGLELSTRRKAAQQIVGIRKEQIAAETAEIVAGEARISAAKAQARIGEAVADRDSTALKLKESAKAQEALQVQLQNATNDTERQKITADLAKGFADQEKQQAEYADRVKKRLVEDFDERRALLKAQRDLGKVDQATSNAQILINDAQQADLEISQLQANLGKLAKTDTEGRQAIAAKIAAIESKKEQAQKAYFEAAIQLSNQYYQQQQTAIEIAYKKRLITEGTFATAKAENEIASTAAEIVIQQQKLARLGAADFEGRNAINARINELDAKRIAALDGFYNAQLEIIKRAQTIANQVIQQSEVKRATLAQIAANRQLSTLEQTEQAKLTSQKQSAAAQLAAAKDNEAKLAQLANITRSPEAERAYQSEVRAARLTTAQATLKQLEVEGQQIAFNRTQAIKAIEEQQAARNRATDRELANISTISGNQQRATKATEAGFESQSKAIDRVTKSLEIQNSFYQAQINLAKAVQSAGDIGGNLEAEKVKSAIELTKQLQAGNLSDRERIAIQERLNQLVGSSRLTIGDLTAKQQQIDQDNASRKQAALLFEQEQARIQLTLDQQKNDLANQRAIIEARIGELKAKQALLDAQSNLQQARVNDQRAIGLAEAEKAKAEAAAPGRDRDRQVADAQNKLDLAKQTASVNQANALQGIDLAKEQVKYAGVTVDQAKAAQIQQTETNRLQTETLKVQQQSAIAQAQAAESARQFADNLERAKLASQGINVNAPTVSPISTPTIQNVPTPQPLLPNGLGGAGNSEVVGAIQRLQSVVESREPKFIQEIKFENATDSGLDEFYRSSRSVARTTAQTL